MQRTATRLARNRYLFRSFDSKPPFHTYLPTDSFLDGIRSWSRPCAFPDPNVAPRFVRFPSRKSSSGSWRPKLGGARPEHVDTIAITSTWIARLLRSPTGQDGACESLRTTIWKVDGTGWRRGTRRKAWTADECPKGTTVVGKRLGGEPTRRGRPDGTYTCQDMRWRWSLHGLDRTGWVHAKKQTRFAIFRTNADGT